MSRAKALTLKNKHYYDEIAINIRLYRKRNNYSREFLAEKAGISTNYLATIESLTTPTNCSLEVLFEIANVLEVEPYKLLEKKF